MAAVTNTWGNVDAPTTDEVELKLRQALLQAQLHFWEQQHEQIRRQLENIALRGIAGHGFTIHHQGKSVAFLTETTAMRMSGDIP
jgi:hypothetical protein